MSNNKKKYINEHQEVGKELRFLKIPEVLTLIFFQWWLFKKNWLITDLKHHAKNFFLQMINVICSLLLLGHPRRGGLYKSARHSVCLSVCLSVIIVWTNERPGETTRTNMSAMVWYCVLAPWKTFLLPW